MEQPTAAARTHVSDWLLLALIFALPLMNPPVRGQAIAADLLFLALLGAVGIELLARRRKLQWIPGFVLLLVYVAGLAPSLLSTSKMNSSLLKLATEFYLVGLAAATAFLIDSEAKFRRAVLAWLTATAIVCLVAVLSLAAFVTGHGSWLLNYSSFGFGSLPPGDYPRLALTFFNANMACNYLTVSFALLLIARHSGYIGRAAFAVLLAGTLVAAVSTISPGLGGIALLAGVWAWITRRAQSPLLARAALFVGIVISALFVAALAFTIVGYPTAPFQLKLPGGITVYPAPRFLTWSAAFQQFVHHPLIGIGIGIDPVDVRYTNPSGGLEQLTDAHNLFLSIAAQCGLAGLAGLGAILVFVIARMKSVSVMQPIPLAAFVLGAAFLDAFVYQGLGGSFEDTRHIWVLLGLFMAACRLDLIRADGSNRKADAPSHC